MTHGRGFLMAALAAAAVSCQARPPAPAPLDTGVEACRFCRMPVSDPRLSAQLSAPGEEALFFDDIGCLRDFLRENPAEAGAVAYVADHRSPSWIPATAAVFSRCPSLETPMGSHLMAHASAASRDQDAAAKGCIGVSPEEVFGSSPPSGRKEGY